MADYKPSMPFNVTAFLFVPITKTVKGVTKKTYPKDGEKFFCSFRTFGGTERVNNDMLIVENTAIVETWFNPKIKSDCRVRVGELDYEILGTPENINMRNQYMKFKIRAVKGGA